MQLIKMNTSQSLWTIVVLCILASLWSPIEASSRTKRDIINRIIKKKGLAAAATALFAAASMTKKKFLPIPIVFPLSIMKPPIVETIPVPPPFVGKHGSIHSMNGGLIGGGNGYGGLGMSGMYGGGMGMGMGGMGGGGMGFGR